MRRRWCAPTSCRPRCGSNRTDLPPLVHEDPMLELSVIKSSQLKALDVESSKVIDLEKFVPRNDVDPVYFDSSYYSPSRWSDRARDAPGDRRGNGRGRSRRARTAQPQP